MGLRNKTASITPLIRANMSCAVTTIFSSLAFLALSVSMANLSHLVAASFSSLVSMANLSCLLATTSPVLGFSSTHCRHLLFNALSSPRFNLLRVARHCFSWFSVFLFSRLILSLSFLCSSVSEALFALSYLF